MEINQEEINFHEALNRLADACNYDLRPDIIESYDKWLSKYGYVEVTNILNHMVRTRSANDRFPSIYDIEKKMISPDLDPEKCAIHISYVILNTLRDWKLKYISNHQMMDYFEKYNGVIARRTVEAMGGYSALYDEFFNSKNISFLRNEIRIVARMILDRENVKQLEEKADKKQKITGRS